jgi:orotate phosphoribosyltransferase
MTEQNVLKIFEQHNALLTGHFKLSSGLHSEKYLQCALVLQHPEIAERLAKALAAAFVSEKIGVVVGPALGGVTLAYEVARALGVRGIFTERQDGAMVLRRGFAIQKGERVLVCEDVVTTGGSTKEVMDLVTAAGGIVIGVGSVIDRSDTPPAFGVRFASLAKVKVGTYAPEACPLCRAAVPVTKPGSRK